MSREREIPNRKLSLSRVFPGFPGAGMTSQLASRLLLLVRGWHWTWWVGGWLFCALLCSRKRFLCLFFRCMQDVSWFCEDTTRFVLWEHLLCNEVCKQKRKSLVKRDGFGFGTLRWVFRFGFECLVQWSVEFKFHKISSSLSCFSVIEMQLNSFCNLLDWW